MVRPAFQDFSIRPPDAHAHRSRLVPAIVCSTPSTPAAVSVKVRDPMRVPESWTPERVRD